jgi:hypothetical protein
MFFTEKNINKLTNTTKLMMFMLKLDKYKWFHQNNWEEPLNKNSTINKLIKINLLKFKKILKSNFFKKKEFFKTSLDDGFNLVYRKLFFKKKNHVIPNTKKKGIM